MNSQKSLLAKIIETIDQHRAERPTVAAPQEQRPSNLPRFVRWFPTPGNVLFTLLVAGLLVMTQHVWATPNLASVPGASATTVNYQGRLENSSGNPLSGPQNLQFGIYDTDSSGNLIWGPESHTSVSVNDGLFSVGLGSQTAGGIPTTTWDGDRYLEITVNGETLTPRELIRSVPIAGMALTVPDGAIGSRQIKLSNGRVEANIPGAVLALTSNFQTIPGATFTVSPETDLTYLIYLTADLETQDSLASAELFVDGEAESSQAIFRSTGLERGTVSQTYLVHLSTGTHTMELKARLHSGTNASIYETHTSITYIAVSQ